MVNQALTSSRKVSVWCHLLGRLYRVKACKSEMEIINSFKSAETFIMAQVAQLETKFIGHRIDSKLFYQWIIFRTHYDSFISRFHSMTEVWVGLLSTFFRLCVKYGGRHSRLRRRKVMRWGITLIVGLCYSRKTFAILNSVTVTLIFLLFSLLYIMCFNIFSVRKDQ